MRAVMSAAGVKLQGDKELIQRIINALKEVYDPEIPVNVYDLGLIYEIRAEKGESGKPRIYIAMTLTAVGCPIAGTVIAYVEEAVREAIPEAEDVTIDLVFDPPWTPERITPEGREQLKAIYGYDVVEQWIKQMKEMEQQEEA
ncbi:metal-sulfur cluster assembly factor [Stetteria hydrogenophila]